MIVRVRIRRLTVDGEIRTAPSAVRAVITQELSGLFKSNIPPPRQVKEALSGAITKSVNSRVVR